MSKAGRKAKPGKQPSYLTVVENQAKGIAEPEAKQGQAATPKEEIAAFECPDWFSERDRKVFEFLQEHLRRHDLLDEIDQIALQILARTISLWQQVQEAIEKIMAENDGSLTYKVRGRNGLQYKTRPEVGQAREFERTIAQFGSDYGLTPVARERIKFLGLNGRRPGDDQGDLYD